MRIKKEGFVEVCRRGNLKVNVDKGKGMVLEGEEGSVCEIIVDGRQFEHVSKFKYMGFVLDGSVTDVSECCRRKVISLRSLQLAYARLCMRACLCLFFVFKINNTMEGEGRIKN